MGIIRGVFAVLIPGGAMILRRKYLSAAAIMAVWTVMLEAYLLLKVIRPSGVPVYVEPGLLTALVSVFAANVVLEIILLARASRSVSTGRLDEIYSEALAAFVAGEDQKADELLKSALRLDGLDPDCLLLRAQVAARLGKKRRARRLLRKCRDFDEKGKWKWEIHTLLEHL
jgi:hypothetical protein